MTFWGERSFGVLRAHFLLLGDSFAVILMKFWSSLGIKKGGGNYRTKLAGAIKAFFAK